MERDLIAVNPDAAQWKVGKKIFMESDFEQTMRQMRLKKPSIKKNPTELTKSGILLRRLQVPWSVMSSEGLTMRQRDSRVCWGNFRCMDTKGLRLVVQICWLFFLKSLPEIVKNYILHHSSADMYESYRNSAMRWEEQQRPFNDFDTSGKKVHSLAHVVPLDSILCC